MSDVKIDTFRDIPLSSMLHALPVFESDDKTQYTQVLRSFIVPQAAKQNAFLFEFYIVDGVEFLDTIAAKFYGYPQLYWLIAEFNDITNPFEAIENGQSLKILRGSYLHTVYDDLMRIGEL